MTPPDTSSSAPLRRPPAAPGPLAMPRRPPAAPPPAAAFQQPVLPEAAAVRYVALLEAMLDEDAWVPVPDCLPIHTAANKYRMVSLRQLRQIADGIKAQGLLEKIVIHNGRILDGRNRLAACFLAGVKPLFRPWTGEGVAEEAFIRALNEDRRQLSPMELVLLAQKEVAALREEARERQVLGGKGLHGPDIPSQGLATDQAAARYGAGKDSVRALDTIVEEERERGVAEPLVLQLWPKLNTEHLKALRAMTPEQRTEALRKVEAGTPASEVFRARRRLDLRVVETMGRRQRERGLEMQYGTGEAAARAAYGKLADGLTEPQVATVFEHYQRGFAAGEPPAALGQGALALPAPPPVASSPLAAEAQAHLRDAVRSLEASLAALRGAAGYEETWRAVAAAQRSVLQCLEGWPAEPSAAAEPTS